MAQTLSVQAASRGEGAKEVAITHGCLPDALSNEAELDGSLGGARRRRREGMGEIKDKSVRRGGLRLT